jgi:hypothetical protein
MPFAPVSEEGSDHGNAGTSAFCPSSGDTMWVPSSALPRDILQSWCRRDSVSQRNCKQFRALGSMKNDGCSKTSMLKRPVKCFFFPMVAILARLLSAEPEDEVDSILKWPVIASTFTSRFIHSEQRRLN